MRNVVVELLVVFLADLALGAGPESAFGIEALRLPISQQTDRDCEMVGISLDDFPETRGFEIFLGVILEMEADAGPTVGRLFGRAQRTATISSHPRFRRTGFDDHSVGRHEGGIEAGPNCPIRSSSFCRRADQNCAVPERAIARLR